MALATVALGDSSLAFVVQAKVLVLVMVLESCKVRKDHRRLNYLDSEKRIGH